MPPPAPACSRCADLQPDLASLIHCRCICSKSTAKPPLKVETLPRPGAPLGPRPAGEVVLDELQVPVEIARLDRPDKVSTTAAIVAASPGVIAPSANAEVTAFIAAAISAALSIGGSANLTVRSRQAGRIRSRQSRIAVGSPTSASSTALRVKASDSPSSNAAAAMVVLLREPVRRPAGLPERPLSNGRPRTRPSVLVKPISHRYLVCRSTARRCEGLCDANRAILWSSDRNDHPNAMSSTASGMTGARRFS